MSQHECPERLSNRSKGFQDEAGQATMEVLVETLTGTAFEMTVSPSDTVFEIKSKIFRVEGIPVAQQHLLYRLKELEDSCSLRALGVADGARLRLVLGMRGGPISTRRLPPPPSDISGELERLLSTNSYREGWAPPGCKVTVLVFRDGERVNMLRVREPPLDADDSLIVEGATTPPSEPPVAEAGAGAGAEATRGKMQELRRRMGALELQRRPRAHDKSNIQKTRSEETLSVPSLLDDYTPFSESSDAFPPLYDGAYTRYDCDCPLVDRYTLLPPIGSRTSSEQSVHTLQDTRLAGARAKAQGRRARSPPPAAAAPGALAPRARCALCRRRLGAATLHRCRCGAAFCAPHRYAEVHGCAYDYKAAQRLRPEPLVSAPKLPKI